ncbi:ABC transporter permease [Bacillus benzoevorans]|uniref:ABC-2 type transport system permease protein n=1 Tax=Bacillus benzoevorans TaxID=1456 RepID=A0A7X0HVG0_9BACI|nr:ABC transporter permease [Bacillus benzoevorans]MBB6446672.1 ABC-2 type transport system permease protein [Bacillus benzoevorans]
MIWQIVKKQALMLWRNPVQLFLLLGLPIVLIAILGTALSSTMDGGSPEIHVKLAFIEHGNEPEEIESFIARIDHSGLPAEVLQEIKKNADKIAPIGLLKDVFSSDDLAEMIEIVEAKASEKEGLLQDDSYTAIIEVPKNFTYETLQAIILQKGTRPELTIYQNEGAPIGSSVVSTILEQFQKQLTMSAYLGQKGIHFEEIQQKAAAAITDEMITINQKEPVSTKSYYAIGMAVMNVFFIASAISTIAYTEKKLHVFDRMILGNLSRWVYFFGVFLSGTIFALLQLLLIFAFSWLAFGVSWNDLLSFITITISYAVAIGGITVLLTAINYRLNSEMISNFFSSIIVTLLSFVGGSFYPIGDFSKPIQRLGDFTPNGATMSAYLKILRGDGIAELSQYMIFLILFALAAMIVAALSFPKRGAQG